MSFNYQQRGKFSLKKGMLGLLVSLSLSGYGAAEYTSGGMLQIENKDDQSAFEGNIWGIDVAPNNQLTMLAKTEGSDPHVHRLGDNVKIDSSVGLDANSGAAQKKKIRALNNDKVVVLGEDNNNATLHEVKFDSGANPFTHGLSDDNSIPSAKITDITFGHEHLYTSITEENSSLLLRWEPNLVDNPKDGNLDNFTELMFDGVASAPVGPIAAKKEGDAHVYLATDGGRSLIALRENGGAAELVADDHAQFNLNEHDITGTIQEIQASGEKLYLLIEEGGARKIVEMDKIGGDGAPNPDNTKTLVTGLGAGATFSIAPSLGVIYVTNDNNLGVGKLGVYFDPSGWDADGQVNLHRYTLKENLDLDGDKTLHVQDTLTIEGNRGEPNEGNPTPTRVTLNGGELKADQIILGQGDTNFQVDNASSVVSPISGAGSLIKTGGETLTLGAEDAPGDQASNSYSGDTQVQEGKIVLEKKGASASSTFVLSNGTTLEVAKSSTIKGLSSDAGGTVSISDGQTLTLKGMTQPLIYAGTVTGGQSLTIAGGTQRFTGAITANTTINAGAMELHGNTHTGSIEVSGTLRAFKADVTEDVTLNAGSTLELVVGEDTVGGVYALTANNLLGNLESATIQIASAGGLLPMTNNDGDQIEYSVLALQTHEDINWDQILDRITLGQRLLNVAQKVSSVKMEDNNLFITLEEAAALAAGNATGETATYVAALEQLADSGNASAQRLVQILADKTPAQIEEIVEQFLPRDTAQVSDVSSQASAATRHSIRTHLRNQSQKTTTTRQMNAVSTRAITNQEKDRFVQLVQQASAAPAQGIQKLAAVSASHKGQAVDTLNSRTARLPDELNVSLNRVNVWLQQAIARGDFSKRRHAKAMKSDIYTTTAGIDYRFTDRVLLGVFFGYGKSDFNFAKSQGSGTVKSFSGGLYGSWNPYQTLDVDFSAMIAKHDYRKKRSTVLGNIRSNHDGVEYGLSARASYGFAFWDTGEVRPYVETGIDQLREERYREKGVLANTVSKRRSTFWNAGAGVEVSKTYAHKNYMLRPSATVGFIHRNASGDAGRVQYNLGNAAGTYRIKGESGERNRFLVGANVATLFKNDVYVTVGYNGELSSKDKIHEGLVRVGVTF